MDSMDSDLTLKLGNYLQKNRGRKKCMVKIILENHDVQIKVSKKEQKNLKRKLIKIKINFLCSLYEVPMRDMYLLHIQQC